MVIAYQPYFYWTPYQLRKTTELCNFVFPLYLQTHLVYDGERTGVLSNAFNAADMTIEDHRTTSIEIFSIVGIKLWHSHLMDMLDFIPRE